MWMKWAKHSAQSSHACEVAYALMKVWAVLVMVFQRLGIVLSLVAEERAKCRQIGRAAQQNVPVMVADLVAKMPDQRAIRLLHLGAPRLALRVVGFGYVERDFAFVVPRQHFGAGIFREEIEHDPMRRIVRPALHRQTETQQIVDHAMLGALDLLPQNEIAGLA
jgi:hypothetical protein